MDLKTEKIRIDSEFYQKQYLITNVLIKKKEYTTFGNILETLTDYHANGSYEVLRKHVKILDDKDYAHMIRTSDFIRDDFELNVKYITERAYEFLSKSVVNGGEILINKIGSNAGQSFLMPNVTMPTSLGMNIFLLRLKKDFSSKCYYAFLNTKYGKALVEQKVNGAAPQSIDKNSIRDILVPIFGKKIQSIIDVIFEFSEQKKAESKIEYRNCEKQLLNIINFNKENLNEDNINIKCLSNSFIKNRRFDPEYYQPKYDNLVDIIQNINHDKLINLVSIFKSIEPGSKEYMDSGIPFVRVSDLSTKGISESDVYLSPKMVNECEEKLSKNKTGLNIKSLYPKVNTILLSKDGSVGIAYKVKEEANFITSSAILHLRIKDEKKLLPDYLTLYLNSELTQLQAERDAGGSIIQHWRVEEIENLLVPVIDIDKQKELSESVQKSFKLLEQSQRCFHLINLAVEKAIEEGEDNAIKYVIQQLNTLGIKLIEKGNNEFTAVEM